MKLYYSPGACSLSPHIVLHAAGLPFSVEKVNLRAQPHVTASGVEFSSINPKGYVPALQLDDGTVLSEGVAIVQYLADQVPERKLAPANGTLARYRLQEWLNYIATEIHKSFSPLFYPGSDEVKNAAWDKLTARFAIVEAQLASSPYLLGEDFSVADAYLFTCLNWVHMVHRSLADFPAISAFMQRVQALPAVQAALQDEGLLR
ncbi:glutathione transferase GstA [Aquitalea palustris]|uniref:Glutathione transferase GstA n=1 Tax=Aquitalea palustris TaxID=2480983 RepID=A0A454JG74_9NEIS|nr:glutathione transferase GstA [Aquitalea palustris]RMC95205.1 glutathione transferase GstA [Aquitalea palustris]